METFHKLALALYLAPLIVAGVWDLRSYRIPNVVPAVLVGGFVVAAATATTEVLWLHHVLAFVIALAMGAVLFAVNALGGGDVKLMAATALWCGIGNLLPLLLTIGLAGGGLALLLLAVRSPMGQGLLAVRMATFPEIFSPGGRVPYGLAIMAGGISLAGSLPV
ncbi:MAG: prepilin peptidase [Solirubrobacterales bacterium]